MLAPLRESQTRDAHDPALRRIFLLTDGSVSNAKQVIEQAERCNEKSRVFSFGLGNGCDERLVSETARAGRGSATFVKDKDPSLSGLVIKALSMAMGSSFKDTVYGFNNDLCAPHELYRNTLISCYKLMTVAEFEHVSFKFKTYANRKNSD